MMLFHPCLQSFGVPWLWAILKTINNNAQLDLHPHTHIIIFCPSWWVYKVQTWSESLRIWVATHVHKLYIYLSYICNYFYLYIYSIYIYWIYSFSVLYQSYSYSMIHSAFVWAESYCRKNPRTLRLPQNSCRLQLHCAEALSENGVSLADGCYSARLGCILGYELTWWNWSWYWLTVIFFNQRFGS